MREIELKFRLDADRAKAVRARLAAVDGLQQPVKRQSLRTTYYDTTDHALAAAGIALRLRKAGRKWLQTVKMKTANHGGLQSGEEFETAAPGGRFDFPAFPEPVRARLDETLGDRMPAPLCETAFQRTLALVDMPGGGKAEVALDEGEIIAGEISEPLIELELELVDGQLTGLYDLAKALLPNGGLDLSERSKAARGYALAAGQPAISPATPRNAGKVALQAGQSSETAARDVLRDVLGQIGANAACVRSTEDPEGPHQLRVGLRRLRSALAAFSPAIGGPGATHLSAEARWLGGEIGRLRDLDVARTELLAPEAEAHPHLAGFTALIHSLEERTDRTRADVRATLEGSRATLFLHELAEFVETRGWLDRDDHTQTARLARPVEDLAKEALAKRWAKVRKRAKKIETLDIEARHELRKELKKLRYGLEFFAPVLPGKTTTTFVKRLKKLQQLFGDLNDLAMAETLFLGAEAPAGDDPDAQRAIGYMLGKRSAGAETAWHRARSSWADLADTSRPWE